MLLPTDSPLRPMTVTQPSEPTPATQTIIRYALLAGVLIFGGIAWFVSRENGADFDAGAAQTLRYAFYVLLLSSAVGLLFIHRSWQQAKTFQERFTRSLIGYAVAEGTALFGAVYLLLTGIAMLYVIGLVLFLIAFMVFSPAPSR